MKEILPHVFHWARVHPTIGIAVSSYYLADEGILIDPLIPDEGLEWFSKPPGQVLLTNRHHYRESGNFADRFGCTVHCVEQGMHEFTKGESVDPFKFGDELVGRIAALEIGVICPDETALYIPRGEGLFAFADGVVREGDGPLSFVPDQYMGEDPAGIKAGLKEAYGKLLDRDFDHLLLAHGDPWIEGGKQAVREFVES